jgi:hypothetical protein
VTAARPTRGGVYLDELGEEDEAVRIEGQFGIRTSRGGKREGKRESLRDAARFDTLWTSANLARPKLRGA